MGAGKSSALINFINDSSKSTKFLFVTPYLREVKRVVDNCPDKYFKQPIKGDDFKYSKLRGLKILLDKGENIATTHALFHYFDEEVLDLIYNNNYILILDEVTDVVNPYLKDNPKNKKQGITRSDLDTLLDRCVRVDKDTGFLEWVDVTYSGKLDEYRIDCEMQSLALYSDNNYPLWLFPAKIFGAFKESYVLTYMFDCQIQRYYYDMHHLEYDYMGVDYIKGKYRLVNHKVDKKTLDYSKLIHICDKEKLNRIGGKPTDLSKSWYVRNRNNALMGQLRNNTYNYFKNMCDSKSENCIWTTFKSFRKDIQGKGYTKGFLSCNMRATNDYSDRHCVAYLMNRYMNPVIKNFFLQHNIQVDEDGYALSEMLQFIWRSAIRKGEKIWVYIPSVRMRTLLQEWIKQNS